jgi:hypothetical protein
MIAAALQPFSVPSSQRSAMPGRLTLAGFLAGYRGLTGERYALDLRQFSRWCCT